MTFKEVKISELNRMYLQWYCHDAGKDIVCWEVQRSEGRPIHIHNYNFIVAVGFEYQLDKAIKRHFFNTMSLSSIS